jgi:hypothetical protein
MLNAANTMKTDWNWTELGEEDTTISPWRDCKWVAGFIFMMLL